jgi:hypothetical protein
MKECIMNGWLKACVPIYVKELLGKQRKDEKKTHFVRTTLVSLA